MPFERLETPIEGLMLFRPKVFSDSRGYFMESYQKEQLEDIGLDKTFVQDNLSYSTYGVLRGLHFQLPPYGQGKLVSVLQGTAWDVAVDLRKDSSTYGQHFAVELNSENPLLFYIPVGFAHGFLATSKTCLFHYKCTAPYQPQADSGLRWNDSSIGIPWPFQNPVLSEKDKALPTFRNFKSPF